MNLSMFVRRRVLASGLAALVGMLAAAHASAEPAEILFVGNSFTYTRPPVLQYNYDTVDDMNYANFLANPTGADPALPQPWGGIPAVFKMLSVQANLDVNVRHSLRGGATLRGHYLNTNPAGWDMRANIAARKWDAVVLQGNSTEALDVAGGSFIQFSIYASKLERWIHVGAAESYRERDLFPGGNNTLRVIPANPNASASTAVYLYQTWARPDLTYPGGSPYFGQPLEAMTRDLAQAYADVFASNGNFAAVAPVGEAFMRAVQTGVALRDPYNPERKGLDLWWHEDQFHSSKYGSYLSALVLFGTIMKIDPTSFGGNERAAADLGISSVDAVRLQRVAADQLLASGIAIDWIPCERAPVAAQVRATLHCRPPRR